MDQKSIVLADFEEELSFILGDNCLSPGPGYLLVLVGKGKYLVHIYTCRQITQTKANKKRYK